MKQVQRFVIIALALLLVGVPAVSLAQTQTTPSAPSSGAQDKAKDKPAAPSASPSTSGSDSGAKTDSGSGGQASPMAPASAEDCKKDGWQKLGFKTEAECTSKVKK